MGGWTYKQREREREREREVIRQWSTDRPVRFWSGWNTMDESNMDQIIGVYFFSFSSINFPPATAVQMTGSGVVVTMANHTPQKNV